MVDRKRVWTEDEVRAVLEESDDEDAENTIVLPLENSDSEIDVVETDSDVDDEQVLSESENAINETELPNEIVYFTAKDGTQWNTSPLPQGRAPACNIIRGGVSKVKLKPGQHIDSPLDAFSLFISDEVIKIIVNCTNLYGCKKSGEQWRTTDEIEIRCFIGLLIHAGLNKQGIINMREFWHPLFGSPLFRASMSCNRFEVLCYYIRFDDTTTRSARRSKDKFAPIREIWDIINSNLLKYYVPGENLTIDEQLVPFRGKVSFRQYIPSKPDKYGMKIWWICDSSTSYPLKGIPYLGKDGNARGVNLGSNVVQQLCTPFHYTNRNVTFDNFFTSMQLAQELLSVGLTCVGTLRKNKPYIPANFLPQRQRPVESNVFGFRKNMTLVSYVPKKNRAVILLSSMHFNDQIDIENHNKSNINLYYNATKGGVDTMDQMCHSFSSKRKTNRWPFAQFFNIIDVTGVAAKVIWLNLYPEWHALNPNGRRKIFLQEIVKELVVPQVKRRNISRLSNLTKGVIQQVLSATCAFEDNVRAVEERDRTPKKRRCYMCPPAIGRMNKQLCSSCSRNVCVEHSKKVVKCQNCMK